MRPATRTSIPRFCTTACAASAPFFAYIATNAPHTPLICPDEYRRMYQGLGLNENEEKFFGMVTNIDDNVGPQPAAGPAGPRRRVAGSLFLHPRRAAGARAGGRVEISAVQRPDGGAQSREHASGEELGAVRPPDPGEKTNVAPPTPTRSAAWTPRTTAGGRRSELYRKQFGGG
jgi:hypothetical protein